MAKFVIECPNCGKFAEGKTGFFARKKIDCSCGYTINVRTDRMASRQCPHCGNTVVFDQTKGEKALCPVCHEPITTMDEPNLYIVQSNSFDGNVRMRGGRYLTNLPGGTGLGLESIQATAEKYHGTARFHHEGKIFSTDIRIPLDLEK